MGIDTVFLHVTKACNLRCAYCYFSADRPLPDELTQSELIRLWPELVTLCPKKVVFTGGEPLLRPDLLACLRSLRDIDVGGTIRRCLNTNGLCVTDIIARELVGLIDEVRVSIDALQINNDLVRGSGTFDAALKALKTFREHGFEPKALVTITSVTIADLEELLTLLYENEITRINLNVFRPIGRGKMHPEWVVGQSEISTMIQRVLRNRAGAETVRVDALSQETQCNCGVGYFVNIMPNGDVFPCHVLTHSRFRCGNLREQSLLEICNKHALLSSLSRLDFRQLAEVDNRLEGLKSAGACMGEIYERTKDSKAWEVLSSS